MKLDTDTIVKNINDAIVDYRSLVEDIETKKSNSKKNDTENDNLDRIFSNFKLHDKVVAFYDGRQWNVISLDFMLRHPILIYKHWSDKDQVYYDNSLLVCPLTLRSMIYKGKIKVEGIKFDYELILLNEDTNDTFPISNPYTGHRDITGAEKKIKSQVKRLEVKILEHRDIFAFESDPKYLIIDTHKQDPIINMSYLENRIGVYDEELITIYHPKSLVYVVQYYSDTDNAYRHMILISHQISKDNISGYKYRESRFWSYSEQNKDKLIEKRAFTYPILWYTIEKIKLSNIDTTVVDTTVVDTTVVDTTVVTEKKKKKKIIH